jgi:UrcA family protein
MTHVHTFRVIALSLLAASALAASTPASAQSPSDPVRVTVSYGDLNIDRPKGAKVLIHRIQTAANLACGGAPDARVLAEQANFDACRRRAIATAVTAVGSPTLSAMAGPIAGTRLATR